MLTADNLYSRCVLLIQMQLSKKPNSFSCFPCSFRMYNKFQIFRKRIQPHSLSISEIIGSERLGYRNA